MFALVSGAPRWVRIASDQAFWFSPFGVSFCAVGCGVSPPASVCGALEWVACDVVGACVGVAVFDGVCVGLGLVVWSAGIFAVAKPPSWLALACSGAWLSECGTAARVAASGSLGVLEPSGDGTAPT